MSVDVVDTNVLSVANARDTHASPLCVITCVNKLEAIRDGGRLAIDDSRRIVREYQANASSSGQPGPGDAFLKWILQNLWNDQHCEMVPITPRAGTDDNFEEFPDDPDLAGFDRSDRKFVAVALAHPDRPPILNATDTDWHNFDAPLARHGIRVTFLCPDMMPLTS
ncbi:MAG: hypothetical protein AB7R89_05505 [Dehalococcoidia bacterium]